MFRRFIRWLFGDEKQERTEGFVRDLLADMTAMREEIAELREKLDEHINAQSDLGGTYVNEDGEKVPMSQVLNEYLYGKEERE